MLRVQKAINIALQKEKKIAFIGKGSERLVNFARNTNYINIDEESLVNLKYIDEHNKNNIKDLVVFVTGVRNEPYSALNRMVKHEDRLIHIEKGDSIVIVCPPKSGSELYVTNVINELYRSDASITIFDKNDIFGTHATNADLKTLYSILKPKFAMPIKGEYRHMYDHSQVLIKMGYNKEDILTLENGEMIEIVNGEIVNIEKKSLSDIFVNGSLVGGVNEKVIKDRETLSEQGIVIVNVAYDVRTRKLINDPSIITKGFTYKLSEEQLDEIVSNITVKIVNNTLLKKSFHVEQLKEVLQTEISNQLFRYTKHRPIIMISITEVNKPKAKE